MNNTEILEDQIKKLNAKVNSLQEQLDSIVGLLQVQNYLQIANNPLATEELRMDAFNRAMNIANIPEYNINNKKEEEAISLSSSFR